MWARIAKGDPTTTTAEKLAKSRRVLGSAELPLRVRVELLAAPLALRLSRHRAYGRARAAYGALRARLGPSGPRPIDVGGMRVFVSRDAYLPDISTFYEIFVAGDYEADYRDAVVVDLGAHKGYFGAFALLRGASTVLSYEPQSTNFDYLRRAVESVEASRPGAWRAHKAGVGAERGTVRLNVSRDSWTHSLLDRPGRMVAAESIEVVPLADVLEIASAAGERRSIVKMDVEGAECEVILGTPAEAWRGVEELLVELHGFSPCSFSELAGALAEAGLTARDDEGFAPTTEFTHKVVRFQRT